MADTRRASNSGERWRWWRTKPCRRKRRLTRSSETLVRRCRDSFPQAHTKTTPSSLLRNVMPKADLRSPTPHVSGASCLQTTTTQQQQAEERREETAAGDSRGTQSLPVALLPATAAVMASERDDERGVGALGLDVAVPRESTVEQAQAAPGASSASTTAPTTPGTAAVNGILSGSGSVGSPRTTKHTTFAEPPASESDQQQQQQRPRFARTRSNGSNSNGGGDRVYTAPGWHQAAQARRNELLESLRRDVSPTDRSGFPDHQDGGPAAGTGPEGGQDGDGDDDGKRGRRGRKGATRETVEKTIDDLRQLLQTFRSFIPSSLRRMGRIVIPTPLRELVRAIVRQVAVMLHRRGALASNVFYDCQVLFWKSIINIFFREIWSRGAWKVPPLGQGAVIFVVGPHHNQVRLVRCGHPLCLLSG